MKRFITPNTEITPQERLYLTIGWILIGLIGWESFRSAIFPSLGDILGAFPTLWTRFGLGASLLSSLRTSLEALMLSTCISLPLAYLSRTPLVIPLGIGLTKLRFLSPSVFFLILLFLSPTPHMVKVLMVAAAETFFLITTMTTVVSNIPQSKFDDAYTMKMGEWQTTWYVVVRGTFTDALDAIRGNAAIGWSMLMMVEGFIRSEGGVGVLLLNQEKFLKFDFVYAIAISIVLVGIFQDYLLAKLKEAMCPYTT